MVLCINRRSSPLFDGAFWFAGIGWVSEMSVTSYGVRGVTHKPPPTHAECVVTATRQTNVSSITSYRHGVCVCSMCKASTEGVVRVITCARMSHHVLTHINNPNG